MTSIKCEYCHMPFNNETDKQLHIFHEHRQFSDPDKLYPALDRRYNRR